MNKIKYLLPFALLAAGSVNAAANAENPFYLGARIGADHFGDSGYTDKGTDKDDLAYGLLFGNNIASDLAIVGGYTNFGEFDIGNGSIEQRL